MNGMNQLNAQERDTLLSTILTSLTGDDRVIGIWLAGSIGRKESDDLSDLDLWVIVADNAISEIVDNPLAFVHKITPTIMHISAPSNAPARGAYLLTWVADARGVQQIDWYWQPYTAASRPSQTLLLFERHPIPRGPDNIPTYPTPKDREQAVDGAIRDAFLMILNSRKHILRGNRWRALDHLRHVAKCLSRLDWLIAYGGEPPFGSSAKDFLPSYPPTTQHDQIKLLRDYDKQLTYLIIHANRHEMFYDAIVATSRVLSSALPPR